MSHAQHIRHSPSSAAAYLCAALLILSLACVGHTSAQTATSLPQVRKVYVGSFGPNDAATKLRARTIEQLEHKANLQIVAARREADAIVQGDGALWLSGYLSTDPRSPSALRQPLFQGFLSVEILGKDNDPLWSYLVTPGAFRSGDISSDLAARLVDKFLEDRNTSPSAEPSRAAESASHITLASAGATFPAPLYRKWFETFQERYPGVAIEYSAVGSEAGIQQLLDGKLDFAASDVPFSDQQMARSKTAFLHFASVIGAVVPAYNLKGLAGDLNFTAEILAGIYLGKIRKWSDPAIRAVNKNAALPDADIVVVHRSDGSGTTFVWTDYLSKLNPEFDSSVGRGTSITWPVGIGAQGNEGVAAAVAQTSNSIGYVELEYALTHQLSFGTVQNRAGKFIQADLSSVADAAANSAASIASDPRVSFTDAPGKSSYPITSFTWWLVPRDISGPKRAAIHDLLQWMLSSGQKECSALAYAPLSRDVAGQELQLLDQLK